MKYRALWSQKPLSAIEEEEDGESGYEDGGEEGDRFTDCRTLTPYDCTVRPWCQLCARGCTTSPERPSSLSHTLSRIIDNTTVNVVGFEDHFGGHLKTEDSALMWNLCQVYGKTRMAIDLVERELIGTKQEMEAAKRVFEDLSAAENDLCNGIERTRSLRDTAVMEVTKFRRQYRNVLDEKTIIKLKANRYQLHLDKMESACSDISQLNYSVKAFLSICREKEKKQTTKPVRSNRLPVRHVTGDNVVNSRHCCIPRRHCPKVNLSLPKPGQTGSEPTHKVLPESRRITKKITFNVPITVDVAPDIPSHLKKIIETELSESAKGYTFESLQSAIGDVGYVVIPEFEIDGDDVDDQDLVRCGQSKKQPVDSEVKTVERIGLLQYGQSEVRSGDSERDVETGVKIDLVSYPQSDKQSGYSERYAPSGEKISFSCRYSQATDHPEADAKSMGRDTDSWLPEQRNTEGLEEEQSSIASESSDDFSAVAKQTVSAQLSGASGLKDVKRIADVNRSKAKSDTILMDMTSAFPRIAQPGQGGSYTTPFIMTRGVGFQKALSGHRSDISFRCSSFITTHTIQNSWKIRNPEYQRPTTSAAVYYERSPRGKLKGSNVYSNDRSVSAMNDNQPFLPPLFCQDNSHNQTTGCTVKKRESRSLVLKAKKPASALPNLSKFPRVKSSGPKQTSESLRAQVRSFTRQTLPALTLSETPNTRFHQVLVISSCSSDKKAKPTLSSLHSDSCRAPVVRN